MLPVYAAALGVSEICEDGRKLCVMSSGPDVAGRPGFIHGGAIAGLLEFAAYAAMDEALRAQKLPDIKPIGVNIEYLRGGKLVDTYAAAHVLRIGARIANVSAEAWQEDAHLPIATARMMFSLRR